MKESTKAMLQLIIRSLRFKMHISDIPRRLSKGIISPLLAPPGLTPSQSYFPDGPSNPLVKPLPSRRNRALSITYENGVGSGQITLDQSQSPLFNKLPAEIRLLIWEAALGNNYIHIRPNLEDRKLEHMKCKDIRHLRQDCWRLFGWDRFTKLDYYDYGTPSVSSWSDFSPPAEGLLALPLTCRRIYSEAISALYTLNTFSFSAFDSITAFSAAILPHRFHQIQKLDIDVSFVFLKFDPTSSNWAGCNDKLIWERAWRVIASMKGLRDLQVRLFDLCTTSNPMDLVSMLDAEVEVEMWRPLRAVSRPKRFVVETTLEENTTVELDDAPFDLVRVDVLRM